MSKYYTFNNAFNITAIRYGGYLAASAEYAELEQCRGFQAFIHVVRGYVSLRSDISDRNHILQPGDTLFLAPSVSYKFRDFVNTYETAHMMGHIFLVAFECSSPLMEQFNERLCTTRQDERHYLSIISTELERTFSFYDNSDVQLLKDANFAGDQIIKNYLELFLISCYRREDLAELTVRQDDTKVSLRHEYLSNQIIEYIQQHIAGKISLSDIAGELSLSVSLIERSFREYTGSSIAAYICRMRIDEAKKLMEEGGHSFTEISDMTGFDNVHYFSSRFRKYTGMTPSQYVKSMADSHSLKNEYIITYMKDPDWDMVPSLELNDLRWGNTPNIRTAYQIAWNESCIMLHASVSENQIIARYDKPNRPVYLDSYTEFFFRPMDSRAGYFNIGINPSGAMYCGYGEYLHDRVRLLLNTEDESTCYSVRTRRTDKGWEAWWSIPVSLIRLFFGDYSLKEGMTIDANCCKCARNGSYSHFLSWTFLSAKTRSFHQPEYFGKMILGPVNKTNE